MAQISRIIALCLFVKVASASYIKYEEEPYDHYPEYKYEYSVHDPHTHDVKSQHESRHGDQVKGYYTLKEADGTTREVHYTADHKNGFQAEVKRSGHATHPEIYKSSSESFYHGYGHGHGGAYSTNNNNLHSYHGYGGAYSTNNNNLYGGASSYENYHPYGASSLAYFQLH